MKKMVVLLVLLVVAVSLAATWGAKSYVKRAVESSLSSMTLTAVSVEGVELELFLGQGELSGVMIANPRGFAGESAVRIPSMRISLEPGSFLSDTLVFEEILLKSPQVTLEEHDGKSNLDALLDNLRAATGPGKARGARQVAIQAFYVTGGMMRDASNNSRERLPTLVDSKLGTVEAPITLGQAVTRMAEQLFAVSR